MQELIELFVKEKKYLKNVTPKTGRFLYQSINAFTRLCTNIQKPCITES
jgi:hypothetical protein